MSTEDIDERLQTKGGGASITMTNSSRFLTMLERGFWAFLGLAITTGSFTVAANLYNLNMNVSKLVESNRVTTAQLQDHEARLRQVERDVSTIEGKVFRGVSGYGPQQESARGK